MKKIITFTVKGNNENWHGNPIPYMRVVGRALWLPKARRYSAWKTYVRKWFYSDYPEYLMHAGKKILIDVQPFTTSSASKARMDIKIFWMNGIHGDPDNIFKGIADALFKNDKFLDGSFESHYSQDGKGRVEISITLDI
jgi:Holliday junction resolvase RusA-like endonuclease